MNRSVKDLTVYTLVGSASSNVDFQPSILARNLLNKYSGTLRILTAPFVCGSAELCTAIKNDPQIAEILSASRQEDITMVGIGEAPAKGEWRLGDYPFDREIIEELIEKGAVGDICGNFFDIHGRPCETALRSKIVSIGLEDLHEHNLVVGVGGGPQKVRSVLGALNGSYLDVLITDVKTATSVLQLAQEQKK